MLGWVTGATRSQQDENIDPDDTPDTPAHVFAARAFKSLLFGTPAPSDAKIERPKRLSRLSTLSDSPHRHSTDNVLDPPARPPMQPRHSDPMASPSKGILVAPGSISTKRKSVTFGALGRDLNVAQDFAELGRRQMEDALPSPIPSPVKVKSSASQQDLRRTLFEERTGSSGGGKGTIPEYKRQAEADNGNRRNAILAAQTTEEPMLDIQPGRSVGMPLEEQTIDLNQPRSTSGQHWKREYERDHGNSKAEMKRLIQYNQMTKSYAEKRDRDAVTMTQRLNAAETKAKSLEKKMQKLTAQLMDVKTQGGDQDAILNEVANQTAEVMKYQSKAERYRAALRRNEVLQSNTDDEEETVQRAPSTEVANLRSKLARLKVAADKAESHASKMEKENTVLSDRIKQIKTARTLQEQQYDEMSSRLKKKEGRLQEDNLRLGKELRIAKAEAASLKEQILAMSPSNPISVQIKSQHAQEKLFDLSYSRLANESTPPTSDEERRSKIKPSPRRKSSLPESPSLDFSLTKETYLQMPNRTQLQKSQGSELDDTFLLPKSTLQPTQKACEPRSPLKQLATATAVPSFNTETDVCIEFNTDFPPTPAILNDPIPSPRKSSPLMKSFIDDLGSRRPLPPERIAAARKRLEEKAAARRGTPKYGRVRDMMLN